MMARRFTRREGKVVREILLSYDANNNIDRVVLFDGARVRQFSLEYDQNGNLIKLTEELI